LRWTKPLSWENLQDPLVLPALRSALLQFKVLLAMLNRPAIICYKFIYGVAEILDTAKGLSLTVSDSDAENIQIYPAMSKTAQVLSAYGSTVVGEVPSCNPARLVAHVFMARRLLDLRPSIAIRHVKESERINLDFSEAGHELWVPVLQRLTHGLRTHEEWLREAKPDATARPPALPVPEGGPSLAPLALWERKPSAVFSEGMKDPILERLFGLIGVKDRSYVEIGTQMGDQCNTRYLRVRYGFTGLMLDDNWQNPEVNQWRHLVTPVNVSDIFRKHSVPTELDLLSIDTDGNEWLLWLTIHRAAFRPRVVVLEFNQELPYDQDLFIRYTPFPVHRLCLADGGLPRMVGASLAGLLRLGNSFGYHLVHLVNAGTTDLIFVRGDVLESTGIVFPAQDNLAGLCALAAFQTGSASPTGSCSQTWPDRVARPQDAAMTTSSAVLAGDYEVPTGWGAEQLRKLFC
jgi:hypothetical protein